MPDHADFRPGFLARAIYCMAACATNRRRHDPPARRAIPRARTRVSRESSGIACHATGRGRNAGWTVLCYWRCQRGDQRCSVRARTDHWQLVARGPKRGRPERQELLIVHVHVAQCGDREARALLHEQWVPTGHTSSNGSTRDAQC